MEKKVYKGILSLVGATSICFLGSTSSFADTFEYEDSATSAVDIIIKEDPNVNDEFVFKFDSVPTGLSFKGEYKDPTSKIEMTGTTEGETKNIVLKTDIEGAEQGNFKVTGTMATVSRVGDNKSFDVDSFLITFGSNRQVDVKNGAGTVLDKNTVENLDTTTSSFYNYISSSEITTSSLTLAASDQFTRGDVFKGTLTYTLAGTVDFS